MYALVILLSAGSIAFVGNCIRNKYHARRQLRFCTSVPITDPLVNSDYDYSRIESVATSRLPI